MKGGGGSLMVWGCFSHEGVGALHLIKGIIGQRVYRDILIDELQFSADLMGLNNRFVFQQDLDPKHTAPAATQFFNDNNVKVLDWSPQSCDVNPIENLWAIVDKAVPLSARTLIPKFWAELQNQWYNLDQKLLKKLVLSIPQRFHNVIVAKRGPTGK